MVSPSQRRAAAATIIDELNISQRGACQIVGISRSTLRRPLEATTPGDPDAAYRQHLREYAVKHPRWGYRRAHHAALNAGWRVNHKKTQRIWREEGLHTPMRRHRKRRGMSTTPVVKAQDLKHVWTIDFQYDATDDGRKFRSVSIIDEFTRESLADYTAVSITGRDVIALIESRHGAAIPRSCARTTRLKTQLSKLDLLVLDELGYVPATKVGAELFSDAKSRAHRSKT